MLDCVSPMENGFYTSRFSRFGVPCYHCGVDLASDDTIIAKLKSLRDSYSTVYPSCTDCSGFITKRLKPQKLKKVPDQAPEPKHQKSADA